ncbi:MAG: hypothetical protein ACRELX_09330, partial [Longimicrobiales bacterium]
AYDADGFHIARMPFEPESWRDPAPVRIADRDAPRMDGSYGGEEQNVQIGDVRPYSALRSARPRYWTPALFVDDVLGTFIGASTGGTDLVGRLGWAATLAVNPNSGRWQGYGAVSLGFLGNPRIELVGSREWDDLGNFVVSDSTRASGVEREDAVGIFATLVRPHWRNSTFISAGVERTVRERSLEGAPDAAFRDPRDDLIDFSARFAFANYTTQPFSISRENGISLNAGVERRIETDDDPGFPREQTELAGRIAGYRALHPFGFANHVIALRASGLLRTDDGASPERIGGVSGSAFDIFGFDAGVGSLLLPVRGFDRAVRWGTRAWTASAEYRMPLALVGRRPGWSPLYIDRISALAFADAGDAWCAGPAILAYTLRCDTGEDGTVRQRAPLFSAGAELVLDVDFASILAARVRAGVAAPLSGPEDQPRLYLQIGSSF